MLVRTGDGSGGDPGLDDPPWHVGAGVEYNGVAKPQDLPLPSKRHFRVVVLITFLIGRKKVLVAILGPFDRAAERPRRERDQPFLGVKDCFRSETAANVVRGNHPDLPLLHSKHLAGEPPDQMRRLSRGPHRDPVRSPIVLGQHHAALHSLTGAAMRLEALSQHEVGSPKDLCDIAETQRKARSEEHTSELQSQFHLVCRLLLEKKKIKPKLYKRAARPCLPRTSDSSARWR